MSKFDTSLIKRMLSNGRIQDLLDLMDGESEYSSDSTENMPRDEEERMLRGDALDHVRFGSKFGFSKDRVIEDEKVYCSRPKEFDEWIRRGAPGIVPDELMAYLRDHPLE